MDPTTEEQKKCILLWISADDDRVDETRELCGSAGYEIIAEIRQNRSSPDTKYYVGPGKIEELGEIEEANHIVTPTDLTPTQIFNIGKITGKSATDRIRVVLELFRSRANSPEARLQVELADLKYQLPILREFIHQGTLSDRPGFLAGGEYRVDYYYQMARKRMAHINEQLSTIRRRRGRTRALRKRRGAYLVSAAGYTNAGKSTLTNAISESSSPEKSVDTADRMFTTIATSTRKMKGERDCIVTDTVGFIRDLPPWLVEGFMSTLEEVFESDIVLLVVDSSENSESIISKTMESLNILRKGNCKGKIVLVFNKTDLVPGEFYPEIILSGIPEGLTSMISDHIEVSAIRGTNIGRLTDIIFDLLPDLVRVRLEIDNRSGSREILSRIRKNSNSFSVKYAGTNILIECEMEERWAGSARKLVEGYGGTAIIDR